jgi:hypothetical protein
MSYLVDSNIIGNTQLLIASDLFLEVKTMRIEELENYYLALEHKLNTGSDRITPKHFHVIRKEQFEIIKKKFNLKTYKFSRLLERKIDENRTVFVPTIRDRIVLEYLKDKLNEKYRNDYLDRNSIIQSIKKSCLLERIILLSA